MRRSKRIVLGRDGIHRDVVLDLAVLLRTRALIQASSGGGKSFLLRRLAEELFPKVQVIIFDPEGEFSTLREKFGFVLVGKGGETPADCRSAELVAHKLLELNASAVIDLYEMKHSDRHRFVSTFLNAMIEAPKKLWHPVVIIFDEIHLFAPEKGAGESEASDAVISLATRGRKRGYCLIGATQRLSKLRKDVAAELANVMIGGTFIDIDGERAATALGIARHEQPQFRRDVKLLEPGQFYVLGRAVSRDRVLVKVGPVQTTHPEVGSFKRSKKAPPTPKSVRGLLPKLADLPKEADKKAKTEADLRGEIADLRRQLAAKPRLPAPTPVVARAPATKKIEVPLVKPRALKQLVAAVTLLKTISGALGASLDRYARLRIDAALTGKTPGGTPPSGPAMVSPARFEQKPSKTAPLSGESTLEITPARQRILQALAEFGALGIHTVSRVWIASMANASHRSSAYKNNIYALKTAGLLEYSADALRLTPKGLSLVEDPGAPTVDERLERCLKLMQPKRQAILKALHGAFPQPLDYEEVARAAESSPTSSAFKNNVYALNSAGMICYVDGNRRKLVCADWLFK